MFGTFEQRDAQAVLRDRRGRGEARKPTTDDGDIQVARIMTHDRLLYR
jgi:hypothetical protein